MKFRSVFLRVVLILCLGGLGHSPGWAQVVNEEGELVIAGGRLQSLGRLLQDQAVADETAARIKTIHGDGPGVWAYEGRQPGEEYEPREDAHDAKAKREDEVEVS